VDALEEDHRRADVAHTEIDQLGKRWLASESLPAGDASRLSGLLGELQALYKAHIAMEEGEVFPAAARAFTAEDRREAGAEMAARRGLAKG
jgi:hypothetical protein